MSKQKIAVIGAGANGASIGADLTNAGEDVILIEQWPEHVAAMRAHGLQINTPDGSYTSDVRSYNLCDVATLRDKFDVVLMLMKAYDSKWAAQLMEPLLKPDGLLIGVQNGMSVDEISSVVGAKRTLGCVIEISSEMEVPGIIERHSPFSRSWFALGSLTEHASGREEEVASLLRHAGSVEIVENIRATKWMKLVSNATTLVPMAILGIPMLEANAIPEMRELMIRSGNEALAAAKVLGHPTLPIFGLKAADIVNESHLVEIFLDTLLAGFVIGTTKTTILQDWSKGRRSEVNEINGLVVSTLAAAGKKSPVNSAVLDFARRIENNEIRPSINNLEGLIKLAHA
jgi:2-dehydropantoate 2-reductase